MESHLLYHKITSPPKHTRCKATVHADKSNHLTSRIVKLDGSDVLTNKMEIHTARKLVSWLCLTAFSVQTGYIMPQEYEIYHVKPVTKQTHRTKKCSEEMQTLCAGYSKAEPNIFIPPQTPFPGVWDGQNLISWRWSLPLPTNPVWWGSM